jgi:hypothetical protein
MDRKSLLLLTICFSFGLLAVFANPVFAGSQCDKACKDAGYSSPSCHFLFCPLNDPNGLQLGPEDCGLLYNCCCEKKITTTTTTATTTPTTITTTPTTSAGGNCQKCGINGVTSDSNIQANQAFNVNCQMSICRSSQTCDGLTVAISGPQSENCAFGSFNSNGATFRCSGHIPGTYTVTCSILSQKTCWNNLNTCGGESTTQQFTISGTASTTNTNPTISLVSNTLALHDQLQFSVSHYTPNAKLQYILICDANQACAPGPGNNLVDMGGTCSGCPITLDGNGNQNTNAQIWMGDNLNDGNGNKVLRIIDNSGVQTQVPFTITGISSGTDPCSQVGACYPTTSCLSSDGSVTSFCIAKSVYDSNKNLFVPLSGNYQCGQNTCTVACASDNCCKTIRGNCYEYTTDTNTGCGGYGSSSVASDIPDCISAGGNTCANNPPQGATLIDPSSAYGPTKCYNTQGTPTTSTSGSTSQSTSLTTSQSTSLTTSQSTSLTTASGCTEGSYRCNGNNLERCTNSNWQFAANCQFGCNSGTNPPSCSSQQCTEGTLRCNGNNLEKCTNNLWVLQQSCTNGCSNNQCGGQAIFAISCGSCEAGLSCSCSLSGTCNRGNWVLSNQQSTPLTQTLRSAIPPMTFNYIANDSGTILAEATCADPANYNSTTVTVTPKFLTCPSSCNVNTDCTCVAKNCNSGDIYVTNSQGTPIAGTPPSFKITGGNYAATFKATQTGSVDVRAICDDPLPSKSVKATITINGTGTTTVPPISGSFSVSSFSCTQLSGTTGAYKCEIYYNNGLNENVILVYVMTLRSTGAVKKEGLITFTLPQAQDKTSTNYYCSTLGTGTYYLSWQAYRQSDSLQINPISWSTASEMQAIVCS